ncbi:hypothetical protein MSIMFB_05253 [Mycobacterium simulans]|uniref:Uncharacterized protein n=1 Tax=Mycobacterium simulans TaxID=627089 RepID=A0A7Z7NCF7_9MYCO|nr:hypothetical protein [Mycobacterium simulans]SOJ57775.1 hypothetical protein MSIMFB_05253 [Mycobacterium simulans]SON60117.1 hypothetical protein MSIMFI_01610 [Mycobacterium simulans]
MFTLLVSWLLVACIPGLLMLATLGLGRLEKALAHDTVTARDVAEFLEQAEAVDVHTLAREGMPEAMDYLHRRQALGLAAAPAPKTLTGGRHRAEAVFAGDHSRSNPQLTVTRHVNRV